MRPDNERMRRQMRQIGQYAGETAVRRAYVSASAGNPAYGIGDDAQYTVQVVTGLFKPVTPEEVQRAGGLLVMGDIRATLLDCAPGEKDELRWRGATYRVHSEPVPVATMLGSAAWRVYLRRGGT